MLQRKTLTKSLHTVSAVTAVALHLRAATKPNARPATLVREALAVLGQPGPWNDDDAVVLQIERVLAKKLGA